MQALSSSFDALNETMNLAGADFGHWASRRSVVHGKSGMVSCSVPVAAQAGLRVLQAGGNAADAAVATAAAMAVVQPTSTGAGGDAFALFYNANTGEVSGMNGSGKSPAGLTREHLEKRHGPSGPLPDRDVDAISVPGAPAAWVDAKARWGSSQVTLKDVLTPAEELARNGFPVSRVVSGLWAYGLGVLTRWPNNEELTLPASDGRRRAPNEGEIWINEGIANTIREVYTHGKDGYYKGRVAQAIVDAIGEHGGAMSLEDLANHETLFVKPLSTQYQDLEVFELPPNGSGLTALVALNILEALEDAWGVKLASLGHNSPLYLHALIEALRLAFADATCLIGDAEHMKVDPSELLSKEYAAKRAALISKDHAMPEAETGFPDSSSDTIYLSVVDGEGNACSYIQSNYMGFGTGLVPQGCGFSLQNRGANFYWEDGLPNSAGPGKRPYHTIIPGMAVRRGTGGLAYSFGVMGGFMQPQGHVQVLNNLSLFGMNVQEAIDAPRLQISVIPRQAKPEAEVSVEDGVSKETVDALRALGHPMSKKSPVVGLVDRQVFGRGHVIGRNQASGVLSGGADPRSDGASVTW